MENIESKSYQVINGFWLKLIAFIFMTCDHVGIFLLMYNFTAAGEILRSIGRVAYPLFVLMLVEGVLHTKNYWRYLARLGVVAATIAIFQIIVFYFFDASISFAYSPFVDLVVGSLLLYLINRKDKWSFLAILPAVYLVGSNAVMAFEITKNYDVVWFPFYLRAGYGVFTLLLCLGIYYAHPLTRIILAKYGETTANLEGTAYHRVLLNAIISLGIFISVLLYYFSSFIPGMNFIGNVSTTWALGAILFVLLYNGQRGYNKKWFQYGSYLYFPLHIILIYLIFTLIFK